MHPWLSELNLFKSLVEVFEHPKIPYSGIFSDGNGWNLFTLPKVCQHLRLNDPAVMANVPTQDEANAL